VLWFSSSAFKGKLNIFYIARSLWILTSDRGTNQYICFLNGHFPDGILKCNLSSLQKHYIISVFSMMFMDG